MNSPQTLFIFWGSGACDRLCKFMSVLSGICTISEDSLYFVFEAPYVIGVAAEKVSISIHLMFVTKDIM